MRAICASCDRPIDLECRGLSGYLAYPAYHEYFCPHCGKQNHARTPGAIVEVHRGDAAPDTTGEQPRALAR